MKKRLAIALIAILVVVFGANIALANPPRQSSASYALSWDVIAGGGGEMASTNYAIKGTVGQASIGPGSSSSYAIGAGYWYGLGERVFEIFLPLVSGSFAP